MNKKKPLLLLVAIPIFLVAISPYFEEIDAIQSAGNPLSETGSDKVCGDRLCSELAMTNEEENDSMTSGYTYTQ